MEKITHEERHGKSKANKTNMVNAFAFARYIVKDDDSCKARIVATGNSLAPTQLHLMVRCLKSLYESFY